MNKLCCLVRSPGFCVMCSTNVPCSACFPGGIRYCQECRAAICANCYCSPRPQDCCSTIREWSKNRSYSRTDLRWTRIRL